MKLILERITYQYEYDSINQILENVAEDGVDKIRAQKYFLMQHGIPREVLEIPTGDALEKFLDPEPSIHIKTNGEEIHIRDTLNVSTRSFNQLTCEQKDVILENMLGTYRALPSELNNTNKPYYNNPVEKLFRTCSKSFDQ